MSDMRPELSKRNPYYISKHRYYELKHFCLQYPEWKKVYYSLDSRVRCGEYETKSNSVSDPTAETAIRREMYLRRIRLIEESCNEANQSISRYILLGVTQELPYSTLLLQGMPCGKDYYYDAYHKFFHILSQKLQCIL